MPKEGVKGRRGHSRCRIRPLCNTLAWKYATKAGKVPYIQERRAVSFVPPVLTWGRAAWDSSSICGTCTASRLVSSSPSVNRSVLSVSTRTIAQTCQRNKRHTYQSYTNVTMSRKGPQLSQPLLPLINFFVGISHYLSCKTDMSFPSIALPSEWTWRIIVE